jgi:hypothetical protein
MKFKLDRFRNPLLAILILLSIYVAGACVQSFKVNKDMELADQSAYMLYAQGLKISNYEYLGDRNRMPVYPLLLSLLYHRGLTYEQYFQKGKIFNILLSIVLLIILYWIFTFYLNKLASVTLLLIIAFTVFLFKAAYFQCELLFYFLNFCTFILFIHCLRKPKLWTAVSAGLIAALAYLTKASMLPSVACFIIFYAIIHIIMPFYNSNIRRKIQESSSRQTPILKSLLILVAFLVVLLSTLYPYMSTSKKVFGRYLYNVNSTFYIWYDSWDEVVKGTRAHGDRVGWPPMPPEQIPSFGKFAREHTIPQVLKRLIYGLIIVIGNAIGGYGYAQYLVIYLLVCIVSIKSDYRGFKAFLKKDNNFIMLLYFASYFIIYYLLYAFYSPISPGQRLQLSQYLPAMFVMFVFLSKFGFNYFSQTINLHFNMKVVHILVNCLLLLDIIFHIPSKILVFSGW